jgi:hypothetical protein
MVSSKQCLRLYTIIEKHHIPKPHLPNALLNNHRQAPAAGWVNTFENFSPELE